MRHLGQRACALVLLCTLAACQHSALGDRLAFSFAGTDSSGERRVTLRDVVFEPAENVQSAELDARGRMQVLRDDSARALTVRAAGLCPVTVAPGPQLVAAVLQPVLDVGGDRTGIGFGARVRVRARHNCPELGAGKVTWRQLEGPALGELEVSADGLELSARMPSFAALHPEPVPRGVVPISPRTQGRVVLEATLRAPGQEASRTLTLTAAARSTGLSSVAVSQPIVIAGSGWHVEQRPPGGKATVQALDGLTYFTADMPGGWVLRSDRGGHEPSTLKLNSLTHDATPYDCARSECHAQLSASAASTPMSHALDKLLNEQTDSAAVSCTLDCHVLGERGLSDGGFHAVAARLGFTWTEHTRWDDLPQALRRMGGVRCTGCHGPGAIPPPEQRSAILRSDVCASCHDAPPRYVHVSEWRSGRMSRSDQNADTRALPCARCHTTAGFLAHNGDRKRGDDSHPDAAGGSMSGGSRESPGGAARDSSGVASRETSGGAARDSSGVASRDSSGVASRDSSGVASRDSPGVASRDSSGGAARDSSGGAARDSSGGAARDSSGVASRDSSGVAARDSLDGAARESASGASRGTRAGEAPTLVEHEAIGIACAVCHAPHAEDRGPRLIRGVVTGSVSEHDLFSEPRTRLCRSCHAPPTTGGSLSEAAAPSGTLWAAEVLVPAVSGNGWERMHTPFAHAQVEKGCIGCHGGAALGQGHVNHSFRAERRVCASCHVGDAIESGSQAARRLQLQTQQLSQAVARFCDAPQQPPPAHPQLQPIHCASAALERASYELGLVLEDESAVFHNAELARALLVDAELQLRNHSGL